MKLDYEEGINFIMNETKKRYKVNENTKHCMHEENEIDNNMKVVMEVEEEVGNLIIARKGVEPSCQSGKFENKFIFLSNCHGWKIRVWLASIEKQN